MIEALIYAALQDLVGGRVYPLVAPQGTERPYLVYSVPSNIGDDALAGMGARRAAVQLDAYAATPVVAKGLIEDALDALDHLEPRELVETQDYEADTRLYRATAEVAIWT